MSSIVLVNIEALGDRVDEVHSLYLLYCYKSTDADAARRMTDATTAAVH